MSISRSSLPKGVAKTIAAELGARAAVHGTELAALADGDSGGTGAGGELIDAVPIYGVEEALLRRDPKAALADARPIGWRTLCTDPTNTELGVALVDSYLREGERDQVRVIRGPMVSHFAAAGVLAEDELEGGKAEYEPRILDFGTLGLTALWLHSDKAADRFYPLGDEEAKRRNTRFVLEQAVRRARLQPRFDETGGDRAKSFDDDAASYDDDRGG